MLIPIQTRGGGGGGDATSVGCLFPITSSGGGAGDSSSVEYLCSITPCLVDEDAAHDLIGAGDVAAPDEGRVGDKPLRGAAAQ